MKVVLTGEYPRNTYERLRALLPAEQFELLVVDTLEKYEKLSEAEIVILRIFKATKEMMQRNPKLKMILRWGAGFDSVDIEEAGRRGILVTNTPGANANAVSELAVMLMLAVERKLLCHIRSLEQGQWSKNDYLNSSFSLNNKVIGIIGGGNIGRQVAKRVRAFGAKVQYYDPVRLTATQEQDFQMEYVPLDVLIATSDILTIHVPLLPSTKHMIGAEQIKQMKPGAVIINTARGGLVDDEALVQAVQEGRLAGAGLDVVEREPLPEDSELLQNPNIIVTPHIGGGTADLGDVIIPILVQDILDYVDGKEVQHVVNRVFLSA